MEDPVKIQLDNGVVRRANLDLGSYRSLENGLSKFLGVEDLSGFDVFYVDEDKETIALPRGCTQDEFETFRKVRGTIRIILKKNSSAVGGNASQVFAHEQPARSEAQSATARAAEGDNESLEDMYGEDEADQKSPGTADASGAKDNLPLGAEASLADILSDPAIIGSIQETLASAVVADFLVSVGQAMKSGTGLSVVEAALNGVPVMLALVDDLVKRHPELHSLAAQLRDFALAQGPDFFAAVSPHHGPNHHHRKCHGHHAFRPHGSCHPCKPAAHFPRHCHPNPWAPGFPSRDNRDEQDAGLKIVHPGVVCDGCERHHDLEVRSFSEGFRTRQGFIAGVRYKSAAVDDFDLCESCESAGYFQQSHGPFLKILSPKDAPSHLVYARPFVHPGGLPGCRLLRPHADVPCSRSRHREHQHQHEHGGAQGRCRRTCLAEASRASEKPAAAIPEDIPEKWRAKVETLQSLGFLEWQRYIPILESENGDLERTVARIVSYDAGF